MSNKKITTPPVEEQVEETVLEAVEPRLEPVEVPASPKAKADTYVAVEGDTYASIAAKFKPAGMTKHAYAVHLVEANGSRNLTTGVKVAL